MNHPTSGPDDPLAAALSRALGTQYELKQLLGRGGMGAVYLAREPFLDRHVAVKVLTAELASDEARERFLREARTAARLSHPHIVPLHTFGQADKLLYYVMGYVDGESLEARLKREGRLPSDEVKRIVSELADALDYAHQSGVVHRDVKPDNVLLDRTTGRAMLTDFGVAKQWAGAETLTVTGVVVGTPQYMSPEQASGERNIDGRSDIYALGVVAYRMATGRLPFEGGTFREIMVQHAARAPVPAGQVVESLPHDVDSAISKALAKDPRDRWRRANELRAALSADSEESLPEELQVLRGVGVLATGAFAIMAEILFIGGVGGWFPAPVTTRGSLMALSIVVITALGLLPAARRFGWNRVLQEAFRQPSWWSFWWPHPWRRRGDLWTRLPKGMRRARLWTGGAIAATIAAGNPAAIGVVRFFLSGDESLLLFADAALFVAFAPWIPVIMLARRLVKQGRAAGLTKVEAARLGGEPTFNLSFWSKPHIAALLLDHDDSVGPSARGREPSDLVREIERLARDGAGSPHDDVYRDAAEAARAILQAIAQCDRELAQLARDADPQERERIRASVGALGAAQGDESRAKAQMRELLDRQLQLFREIEGRQEDLGALRAHLQEQLRTLALQLVRLRADDLDAAASSEITERIRLLMREIEYRVQAAEEVKKLIPKG